jgi:sialate O-acetylesterase
MVQSMKQNSVKTGMALALLLSTAALFGEVKVQPIFGDHAVLQRDKPLPIWGTADPGETVTVQISNEKLSTTADADGKWHLELPKMSAGGPYEMTISGSKTATPIVIHDVLLGEVWLASGQSNMSVSLDAVSNGAQEIVNSSHPQLRMFTVPRSIQPDPSDDLHGSWEVSSPETSAHFSAVGYFFGVALMQKLGVPVGIVHNSYGGTRAEDWTSATTLLADPLTASKVAPGIARLRNLPHDMDNYRTQAAAWEAKYNASNPPNTGFQAGFADPSTDVSGWNKATIPTNGKTLGIQGATVLWFRREVNLTADEAKVQQFYQFRGLREVDAFYVNGVQVGANTDLVRNGTDDRSYIVKPELLHVGANTFAVRLFSHGPALMQFGTMNMSAALMGEWRWKQEWQTPLPKDAELQLPALPATDLRNTPSGCFNAMTHPLNNYALRGVLWYQGEANAGAPQTYAHLLANTIGDWRAQWHEQLPFLIVQLPNNSEKDGAWAPFREAQVNVTKTVPNTFYAVTIDVGEKDNVHPHNKRPVGERLAVLAEHNIYGLDVEDAGPTYASMKAKDGVVRVSFTHADGLKATGATIPNFVIAGSDKNFVPASATLDGDTIVVSSPEVKSPVALRYAWSGGPEGCDLYNAAGLPMAPFRTDDWDPMPKLVK